jgi:ATP-binding protein involved in chromosome partitioning
MMAEGQLNEAAVRAVLEELKDPETGRSVTAMGQITEIAIGEHRLRVTLALTTYAAPLWNETKADAEALLNRRFPHLSDVSVQLGLHRRPPEKLGQIGLTVKSVIAVGSGKGGVGKSTIAASLAFGLARAGSTVGLMDADVYGPSIPHLLGVNEKPTIDSDRRMIPIEVDGLKVMSMGFLVPPGEAVVWRGPMLHGAITNFLRDTAWGELDYLIIDMPPGTGDIALTLSQLLPLTGAVVVCTPQDVALLDAVKAIAMFRKVSIPVLGMVENMSYFLSPDTGQRYDIFGSGGAQRRAAELDVPFLGEVPIDMQVRILGDAGRTSRSFEDTAAAPFLEKIVYKLVKNLASARREKPPLPSLPVLG